MEGGNLVFSSFVFGSSDIKITNRLTGEELFPSENFNFTPVSFNEEIIFSNNPDYQVKYSFALEGDVNKEFFKKLISQDGNIDIKFEGFNSILVQAKTHKKKRINKKWESKYGNIKKLIPFKKDLFSTSITFDGNPDFCIYEIKGYTN